MGTQAHDRMREPNCEVAPTMKRFSRKEFLRLTGAAGALSVFSSVPAAAQTANFTTIAEDGYWVNPGRPELFGATGMSSSSRRLAAAGLDHVNAVNTPRSGPYVRAYMFGGHVVQAIYRRASIELSLDRLAGYHFVELFLGPLYPHAFYDATPVQVDGFLSSGTPVRRYVERLSTLNLPQITVRVVASFGGQPVSAFDLMLPQYRAIKAF